MPLSRRQLIGSGLGLGATLAVGVTLKDVLREEQDPPSRLRESATATGTRFPGDPGVGTLFYGASIMPGLSLPDLEEALDHRITLKRSYFDAAGVAALVSQVIEDHDAARLPVVSSKLPGSWADVASGIYDAWLLDLIDRLGSLAGPVMLSLHHEPEDDAGAPGMDPADWVALQQRAITAAEGKAITILPVLMAWTFLPQSNRDPDDWWVPEASVMGIDCYNPWSPEHPAVWRSFEDAMAPVRLYAQDKPLLVAEYGCRTPPATPELAGRWMVDAFQYSYANDIVGMSYFDSSLNSPDGSWILDDVRTEAMRQCIGKSQVVQLA